VVGKLFAKLWHAGWLVRLGNVLANWAGYFLL